MRSMTIGAALALAAMIVPVASQAADTAIGTVSSGSSALVARDGKVMPAVAGMRLYRGDRVITRAGGSADVAMANNCAVTVGASAMLPVNGASCAQPNVISFDQGRAGYAGKSSAFDDNNTGWYIAGGALLLGGLLYLLFHDNHHHHHNTPTSP